VVRATEPRSSVCTRATTTTRELKNARAVKGRTLSVPDDVAGDGPRQEEGRLQGGRYRAGDGTGSVALREVLCDGPLREHEGEVGRGGAEDAGPPVGERQVGTGPCGGRGRPLPVVHHDCARHAAWTSEMSRNGGGRVGRRRAGGGHTGNPH